MGHPRSPHTPDTRARHGRHRKTAHGAAAPRRDRTSHSRAAGTAGRTDDRARAGPRVAAGTRRTRRAGLPGRIGPGLRPGGPLVPWLWGPGLFARPGPGLVVPGLVLPAFRRHRLGRGPPGRPVAAERIRSPGVRVVRVRGPGWLLPAGAAVLRPLGRLRVATAAGRESAGVRLVAGLAVPWARIPPVIGGRVATAGKRLAAVGRRRVILRLPVLLSLCPPPRVAAHPVLPGAGETGWPGGRPVARSASSAPCSSRAAAAWSTTGRRARRPLAALAQRVVRQHGGEPFVDQPDRQRVPAGQPARWRSRSPRPPRPRRARTGWWAARR